MIQKIKSLFMIDKGRVDKWKKSIKDYFFLRGLTVKDILIPTTAVIICGSILLVGSSVIKESAINSMQETEESLIEAYAVYYRGEHIGIIENKQQADAVLESIREDFEEKYDMETILNEDVELKEILTKNDFLSNIKDIRKTIAVSADVKVKSAVLQIDGKDVAILKDEESEEVDE
jgi:hypothetical protein